MKKGSRLYLIDDLVNTSLILSLSLFSSVLRAVELPVNEQYQQRLDTFRIQSSRQNESAFKVPKQRKRELTAFNESRNLYFGDTHVHTALSFDSYLSGNRLGLREAYRFANGQALTLHTGETMQLSQPLDFVVMTDHAEGFGMFLTCSRLDLTVQQKEFCASLEQPGKKLFQSLRKEGEKRPPIRSQALYGSHPEQSKIDANSTWGMIVSTAEEFNNPGVFTAFAGYEYSPPLPMKGKVHRNIIFKNSDTPKRAVSAFDAATELDLWRMLEAECIGDCDFITIPHNMNKMWGLAYSGRTIDGDHYSDQDWLLRARNEPLAEIFQIKGSSECSYDVGANDEQCNFELNVPLCDGPQQPGCSGKASFVREGLKIGMQLEAKLGINPIQTGFIGSTDAHNSNPGASEEYSYRGASGELESPATTRLGLNREGRASPKSVRKLVPSLLKNPGGLAAVWAKENTRDSLFEAMRRKETYATSGGRIRLRFFAAWEFPENIQSSSEFASMAYKTGVPMGSELSAQSREDRNPEFLVYAEKDPNGVNLQKIQMVKAWIDNGVSKEQVFDIACSGGAKPNSLTHRCPDNGALVNLDNCEASADKGDAVMSVRWGDTNFSPNESSFYYVRVLENPSCRWSTYDALRLGIEPLPDVPATIEERAWSSPIWYKP